MKIIFTKHVENKLKEAESIRLGIKKDTLINILNKPNLVDKTVDPHQSVGNLSEDLSLSVIWKIENDATKVITYYPASKGRYESKILRRR